jgi:hypothetical protein
VKTNSKLKLKLVLPPSKAQKEIPSLVLCHCAFTPCAQPLYEKTMSIDVESFFSF